MGETLLSVINQILDFSKIEADMLELEHSPFSLRECIENTLDTLSFLAAEKNLELIYFMPPDVPEIIQSDFVRLQQILINLIGNAIKFTSEGQVYVQVQNTTPYQNISVLQFSIRDSGIGIPSKHMDRLFKSFSQVDASTTRKFGGTGLGLAISKKLSELLGGTMWAESHGIPGQGSTFHFTIQVPVIKTEIGLPIHEKEPSLTNLNVLITSSNEVLQRTIQAYTQTWGMHTHLSSSLDESIQLLENKHSPDIILADVDLKNEEKPNIALYELIHTFNQIPLMLLVNQYDAIKRKEFPAAYKINKPLKPFSLLNTLIDISQRIANKKKNVLLADQNRLTRKISQHILENMAFSVHVVDGYYNLLREMKKGDFNYILVDKDIILQDTQRFIDVASSLPNSLNKPLIIIVQDDQIDGEECTQLGVWDYIYMRKPLNMYELMHVLNTHGIPA